MISLIYKDWPLMVGEGEITNYDGDVLAGVSQKRKLKARDAASLIRIDYEVLEPVTDMLEAIKPDSIQVIRGNQMFLRPAASDQVMLKKHSAMPG